MKTIIRLLIRAFCIVPSVSGKRHCRILGLGFQCVPLLIHLAGTGLGSFPRLNLYRVFRHNQDLLTYIFSEEQTQPCSGQKLTACNAKCSNITLSLRKKRKKRPKSTILYCPKNRVMPLRKDSEQINKQVGEQRKSIGFSRGIRYHHLMIQAK
jgi:hypothetical protein